MYVDMHSHSVSSDDSRATVEQYLDWIQVLRKRGNSVDGIVLTEHRKFDKDADYSALASRHGVVVLKGSELDTHMGHFLVYGIKEGLLNAIDFSDVNIDPVELMEKAEEHGAIAVPAHPGRARVGLFEHMNGVIDFPGLHVVETLNGGNRMGENEKALDIAREQGFRGIGGSDAHLPSSIGMYLTNFAATIHNESDLVEALRAGEFSPVRLDETSA